VLLLVVLGNARLWGLIVAEAPKLLAAKALHTYTPATRVHLLGAVLVVLTRMSLWNCNFDLSDVLPLASSMPTGWIHTQHWHQLHNSRQLSTVISHVHEIASLS
jgi:hypothetical protein